MVPARVWVTLDDGPDLLVGTSSGLFRLSDGVAHRIGPPRIVYAMALDEHFFSRASRVHATYLTPSAAITVQAGIAIGLIFFLETFPKALDFTVFAILLASLADTLALFRLRQRRPDQPRPYRAFGHPVLSWLYLGITLAIAAAIVLASPRECAVAVLLLVAGLGLYWPVRAGKTARPPGP